jgi:hypothetical protein
MHVVLEGGCLCGKVRFAANQAPLRTLACHCTFCQRMTGSSFYAESIFPVDAVELNTGPIKKYEHTSDESGKKVYVHFCPSCGTSVGLTFDRWPHLRAVSRGCFDDPNQVEVNANIWTRSAQSGVALPAEVNCFATALSGLDGQPNASTRHLTPVMAKTRSDA